MSNLLLINGPNLNLLGTREPEKYGCSSLKDIETQLESLAKQKGHRLTCFQSNAEHELINCIHDARNERIEYLLINPGAFTHTSIAIRDALLGVEIPFIEIHLSNVHKREKFRHQSYFSDIANGIIIGLGAKGYELALQAAMTELTSD